VLTGGGNQSRLRVKSCPLANDRFWRAKRTLAGAVRSEKCQQATLQAWLEMKETTNRGARFDELLRVVRVEPIA
jgi:hypothetical protein